MLYVLGGGFEPAFAWWYPFYPSMSVEGPKVGVLTLSWLTPLKSASKVG